MTKRHYPQQTVRNPGLSLVRPRSIPAPPKSLAKEEADLWVSILSEYPLEGVAVLQVLLKGMNASCVERLCMEVIRREGVMKNVKPHPLLKSAAESRNSFLACLRALNINLGPER